MKLEEHAQILPGVLTSRIVEDEAGMRYKLYDNHDFYKDVFAHVPVKATPKYVNVAEKSAKVIVKHGDVVINLTLQRAAMVHNDNATFLTFNYARVELNDEIDPRYFVYWFNRSKEAQNQIYRAVQSGTQTKKISISSIRAMHITFPSIEEQRIIGKLFEAKAKMKLLKQQRYDLEMKYLSATLF